MKYACMVAGILIGPAYAWTRPAEAGGAAPWEGLYTGAAATGANVIGLWQFLPGKELEDTSGHGHALALRGESRVVTSGKFGKCLESFARDAKHDTAVGAMAENAPDLSPKGAFTIELWLRAKPELASVATAFLVDKKYYHYAKDIPQANHDYCLYITSRGGKQTLHASLGFGTDSIWSASRPVTFEPGRWHHVAFTYDGAGTCHFFVDGRVVGRSRHAGRRGVAPGRYPLVIGDRVGSVHNGFPGWIDQVRLCNGAAPGFTGVLELSAAAGRTVFVRMERDAAVAVSILNDTGRPLADLEAEVEFAGRRSRVPVGRLAAGAEQRLRVPVDTRMKPGAYRLAVRVGDGRGKAVEQSFEVRIVPRPLPHQMPVLMWGSGDIPRLKAIGFTHDLVHLCDYRRIWDAGGVTTAMDEAGVRDMGARLDEYLANGLHAAVYIYPGRWIAQQKALAKYLRVDREGKPYPRHNISPNFPEVMRFGYNCGASAARTFGRYPAWNAALVHSEIRDGTHISYHPIERRQCREALGFDIPREAISKNGVPYQQIPGFPPDRVIPDDFRLLRFYRWFWKTGDGWNPFHTEVHRGLHSSGRNDLWTFFDPAVRAPSVWGSGGKVDVISQWTYSYPDPIKIGQAADELFAMAAGAPGQGVMKMTQIIWYRSQTAPDLPKDESKRVEWERRVPDAQFITISPDHLREAFWCEISRPVRGIMYHGWGSLVPAEHGSYRYTNPETRKVLTRLIHEVVRPLGPTLLQVPDRPADVAILESFASQMFAGRGTYGWSGGWEADVHLLLQWIGIQPRIVYEETLLRDGLEGTKVLVMPDCDVLPRSVAAAIQAFQARGGIVAADENVAPAISPDILLPVYRRKGVPDVDKRNLQAEGRRFWAELEPFYRRYASTSEQDVPPRCRRYKSSDYVFVVNDRRTYGDYVGQHRKVMEKGLPIEAEVTLARAAGFVYDLTTHAAVPTTAAEGCLRFHTALGPGGGRVYLVTEAPLRRLACTAPERLKRGGRAMLKFAVTGPRGRMIPAVIPLEVRITDAAGDPVEFSGWYGAADGRLTVPLEPALNDAPGAWKVRARELASGLVVEKSITIE